MSSLLERSVWGLGNGGCGGGIVVRGLGLGEWDKDSLVVAKMGRFVFVFGFFYFQMFISIFRSLQIYKEKKIRDKKN